MRAPRPAVVGYVILALGCIFGFALYGQSQKHYAESQKDLAAAVKVVNHERAVRRIAVAEAVDHNCRKVNHLTGMLTTVIVKASQTPAAKRQAAALPLADRRVAKELRAELLAGLRPSDCAAEKASITEPVPK